MILPIMDLDGVQLNWAVFIASGKRNFGTFIFHTLSDGGTAGCEVEDFQPVYERHNNCVIINQEMIHVHPVGKSDWIASHDYISNKLTGSKAIAHSPTVAAMRFYAIDKLGFTADIPENIMNMPPKRKFSL